MNVRRGLLLAAVLLALAGCSTAPEPRQAVSLDDVYVSYLEDEGVIPRYGDAETAITLGHQICDRYERGDNFVEVIKTLTDVGIPAYEAGQISGAAKAAWCPEYEAS